MGKFIDLSGQYFGRLRVIDRAPTRKTPSGQYIAMFHCECRCRKHVIVQARSLRDGKTQSCGCIHSEKVRALKTSHGGSYTPLYAVFKAMHQRCENPNDHSYKWYGARGISVCDTWKDFKVFQQWALVSGYKKGLTIERKNGDGNYCPENCAWITIQEQQKNRRKPERK